MLDFKTLDSDEARSIIDAVVAHVTQLGRRGVAVVVVDKGGNIIAGLRTNGMHPRYFQAAHRKAYSAAVMERDTVALMNQWNAQHAEGMQGPSDWNDPLLTSLHGGICVQFGAEVVGGIGCAGGTGGDATNAGSDWAFAEAGLAALGPGFSRGTRVR